MIAHSVRLIHLMMQHDSDTTTVIFTPHHLILSNGQQALSVALPWAIEALTINDFTDNFIDSPCKKADILLEKASYRRIVS